ncbi:MAG: molybdenum cofactor guanylyltransferase [Bacteriovoracaceae bacterium]|jgi:molybdopterin-guanine dinucleotide biosynthesis protein A|nr:molybdenum cofactor guanylyltransferase [Bacteriovoracaceae bacterium]
MQLKALILCGGKSLRMMEDKSLINYHGKAQKDYIYDLLDGLCDEVYFSYKNQQSADNIINDKYDYNSPTSGILSAFDKDKNTGWLVVACDLPFLDKETIKDLIEGRDQTKDATAYKSMHNQFVEPLCAIYEPKILKNFEKYLELGKTCPRKVLINSNVKLLELKNKKALDNANTPEDKNIALGFFQKEQYAN